MTDLKAISLWQPWASLCVTHQPCETCDGREPWDCILPEHRNGTPMIKRFETRSWPCPPKLIGSRILIHATQREVFCHGSMIGDWRLYRSDSRRLGSRAKPTRMYPGRLGGECVPLPLGAIVGSATIEACYPITDGRAPGPYTSFVAQMGSKLWLSRFTGASGDTFWSEFDISDQLPYGDYRPGRYAWLFTDAAPTTERCPACWGHGFIDGGSYPTDYGTGVEYDATPCPVCSDGVETGTGRCEPIPAKGKQRIWNWAP